MSALARLASVDSELLTATPFRIVNLESPAEVQAAIEWWVTLTQGGGERNGCEAYRLRRAHAKGLIQPALNAEAANICGSSTGQSTTCPKTSRAFAIVDVRQA